MIGRTENVNDSDQPQASKFNQPCGGGCAISRIELAESVISNPGAHQGKAAALMTEEPTESAQLGVLGRKGRARHPNRLATGGRYIAARPSSFYPRVLNLQRHQTSADTHIRNAGRRHSVSQYNASDHCDGEVPRLPSRLRTNIQRKNGPPDTGHINHGKQTIYEFASGTVPPVQPQRNGVKENQSHPHPSVTRTACPPAQRPCARMWRLGELDELSMVTSRPVWEVGARRHSSPASAHSGCAHKCFSPGSPRGREARTPGGTSRTRDDSLIPPANPIGGVLSKRTYERT